MATVNEIVADLTACGVPMPEAVRQAREQLAKQRATKQATDRAYAKRRRDRGEAVPWEQ